MRLDKAKTSCEDRVAEELEGRLKQFLPDVEDWSAEECAKYLADDRTDTGAVDVEDLRQEVLQLVQERAAESVLSVDKHITYRLALSWGGPADYFEFNWDPDSKSWISGRYIFQDWFDGADRPLTTGQVEQLAELFGIYPNIE